MIVTSVQIKTAKTQKHLYCPVFTKIPFAFVNGVFTFYILPLHSYLKIKSSGIERYLTIQSVDKPKFLFLRRKRRIYVFPLTGAAEKHLVSEKPPIQRFFKGTGVVLAEHNNRLPPVAD